MREYIDKARAQQPGKNRRAREAGPAVSAAGQVTDPHLARAEISSLRAERGRPETALGRQPGHPLDQISRTGLIDRADELSAHNQRLQQQVDQLQAAGTLL